MRKQYKTSGEVRKMFTRIGKVGGNTVKGLVISGRIFQTLLNQGALDEKAVRKAANEAGISTDELDSALNAADNARKELSELEDSQSTVQEVFQTSRKKSA